MPLKRGRSQAVVSHNIRQLIREGYKRSQAAAIAYAQARKARKR